MVGMVRFEEENRERACPAIWGSYPALKARPGKKGFRTWEGKDGGGAHDSKHEHNERTMCGGGGKTERLEGASQGHCMQLASAWSATDFDMYTSQALMLAVHLSSPYGFPACPPFKPSCLLSVRYAWREYKSPCNFCTLVHTYT
eukprot:1138725-Pelagomonas_calceolata.AAC.1